MGTVAQGSLFSWKIVERSPEILRLRRILAVLPDEELIRALVRERKGKRDDYPLEAVWNSVIAMVVFGHDGPASLIRELKRNAELREVCGFEVAEGEGAVPPEWVYTRFFQKLFRHAKLVEKMFEAMVEKVRSVLPNFGRHLAVDSKALETLTEKDGEAAWGVKTYRGVGKDGKPWETVKKWFGYKLHLIVDAEYELPVAFEVTKANVADSPRLAPMLKRLKKEHPQVIERAESLSSDKAYDDGADKAMVYEDYGMMPLMDTRDLHHDEAGGKMRPLDPDHHDTIYYSGTGDVCCKVAPFVQEEERQFARMQFMGFEKERGTLKFRCPAAAFGIECHNREACRCAPLVRDGAYGRVVRVPLDRNRRLFLPCHRHSYAFPRGYARRTAVERVFSRVDQVYGFEHHYIRGEKKMRVRVGLALIVMLATAVAWAEVGRLDNVRSLRRAA
jgi:hypothetical protein